MHQLGITGADTSGQTYTLPNGDIVTGSNGNTQEGVRDKSPQVSFPISKPLVLVIDCKRDVALLRRFGEGCGGKPMGEPLKGAEPYR